ncbi:MBL fold metallo-hydrolase [uncultured Methanoregula sp.]|uniref:MBL fold metallo-hydrolase n=1 Tax=uncultured Methanoregula sp. TaxID=1005933 RepID=UPI002AABC78E|nr:MBL fold metallo-hydrolase [uncultured Methanoregula sp.]
MRCTVLASGSKGNSVVLEGCGGSILVDAGLSARETLLRMGRAGLDPEQIQAIIVTHEHGDHVRGLDVLCRKLELPVYATEGTLADFLNHRRTSSKPLESRVCRYHEPFRIGDFLIEPFATSHDAAEPCGFIITEGDCRIGYCTDTGILTPRMLDLLRVCDGIVLESNHCPDMLENGPYPESLKRRIRSKRGHLSNPAAAACLQGFGKDVPHVILAHLSEMNNTPEKAMGSAREGLGLFYEENRVIVATQEGTTSDGPQCLRL